MIFFICYGFFNGVSYCCVSRNNAEFLVSGMVGLACVLLLALNAIRIRRLFPGLVLSQPNAIDVVWLAGCHMEFTESARDTARVCFVLILHSLFHIFTRVRSKISIFVPLCMSLVVVVAFSSSVLPNDAGIASLNAFLLIFE